MRTNNLGECRRLHTKGERGGGGGGGGGGGRGKGPAQRSLHNEFDSEGHKSKHRG